MRNLILTSLAVLLLGFLFSEEFQKLLAWLRRLVQERPRAKYLVYPLAAGVGLIMAGVIISAVLVIFTSLFSYD